MRMEGGKPKVYFASPLFNQWERSFNEAAVGELERVFEVFLPQRDGILLKDAVAEGENLEAAQRMVYAQDVSAICSCDVLVAILDGRVIDEGVAFELGYARALNKLCVGLKTDDRVLLRTGNNPMIECGCNAIFETLDELASYLEREFFSGVSKAASYYPQ